MSLILILALVFLIAPCVGWLFLAGQYPDEAPPPSSYMACILYGLALLMYYSLLALAMVCLGFFILTVGAYALFKRCLFKDYERY